MRKHKVMGPPSVTGMRMQANHTFAQAMAVAQPGLTNDVSEASTRQASAPSPGSGEAFALISEACKDGRITAKDGRITASVNSNHASLR